MPGGGEELVRRVMIGTAGHIDHGKSSLIKALTGVETDHLKEERERGLTIDIGRATLALPDGRLVGIIDVPGHERFIKNMVAGAVSIDIALLVVAADDGVMPQTREHTEILALLGVRFCLAVITKIDLVEEEMVELVREDVESFLAGTPYAGSGMVPVSSRTGEGVEEVRHRLIALAEKARPQLLAGPFRLPVQRVFHKEGFGTVLGGVPIAGRVGQGEEVELLPGGGRGRVRGIQTYGRDTPVAAAGHSCALNVADLDPGKARRGSWVTAPGIFTPFTLLMVRLRLLPGAGRIKSGTPVRLHLGTGETHGELLLPGARPAAGGDSLIARLRLEVPVVAAAGDHLIIRLLAPPRTVGGGHLIHAGDGRRLRGGWLEELEAMDRALAGGDRQAYLEGIVRAAGVRPLPPLAAAGMAALLPEEAAAILEGLVAGGRLVRVGRGLVHLDALAHPMARVGKELGRRVRHNPLLPEVGKGELASSLGLPEEFCQVLLAHMAQQGRVELLGGGRVRKAGSGRELQGRDQELAEELLAILEGSGHRPPEEQELRQRLGWEEKRFRNLVAYLQARGKVTRVGGHYLYHGRLFEEARLALIANCREKGELDIPALRDTLRTTRKYVIPLLEHFDGIGLTARRGSTRVLRDDSAGA